MPARVVVAIPAFNESRGIINVIERCRAQADEVWVIDDGSSDDTPSVARSTGAVVLSHSVNQGKGMAIRTALEHFKQSDAEFIIFMDADGQHDPSFIPAFVQCARDGKADLVLGNRMDSPTGMPPVRWMTNRLMSFVISGMAGQKVPDSQCGFRLLTHHFAERFCPTTQHYDLESEMLFQASHLGLNIASVPVSSIYGGQGSHIHPVWDTIRFLKLVSRYFLKIGRRG